MKKIVTKPYGISPGNFFKLLFSLRMKRLRWLIWVVLLGVIITLIMQEYMITTVLVIYLIISFVVSAFAIYLFANNSKNDPLRMERYLKIDDKGITAIVNDGRSQTTPWNEIGRKEMVGEYYLLKTGANSFIYLHYAAFETEEEHEQFRAFIKIK